MHDISEGGGMKRMQIPEIISIVKERIACIDFGHRDINYMRNEKDFLLSLIIWLQKSTEEEKIDKNPENCHCGFAHGTEEGITK